MILVLATENKDKGKEIATIIKGRGADCWQVNLELRLISDYPNVILPPETGETYLHNATVKARYAASRTGQWALGDDSGLEISALNGAPGLYSSRFAGEGASYADNRKKVLDMLLDIPKEKRLAQFVCTVVIASPDGTVESAIGVCEGKIACSKDVTNEEGFGYDPIFYPVQYNKTFWACSPDEKNQISHRGHAVRAAIEILKKKSAL
jgi:XTP/dITP diphosphohydrolase